MRVLLVVNPAASAVTDRARQLVTGTLAREHDVTVVATTGRGDATRHAQGAAAAGFELVVTLGGDGTLNEAANGLIGSPCPLAGLPGGSTNVFARTLGFPNDAVEAAGVLLVALRRGSIRPVGLGQVEDRYFLFHCGIGFDAAVVERVERRPALKHRLGHAAFVWSAVATWFATPHRPAFSVDLPGGEQLPGAFAVVQNTDPYTFLADRPLRVAPDALLDRPLSLVVLRSTHLPTLLPVAFGALHRGLGGRAVRGLTYRADLTELRIVASQPVRHQVDGEPLGERTDLRFRWHPDAIQVVTPR